MIDIWMLFTMTVPFLEVALHTCTEVMKRPANTRMPQPSPHGRVHQVQPAGPQDLHLPQPLPTWVGVVGRLALPVTSLVFTVIFWIVGLGVSYWPDIHQDPNITDCLTIELH